MDIIPRDTEEYIKNGLTEKEAKVVADLAKESYRKEKKQLLS